MFDLKYILVITACIKRINKGSTYKHTSDHISLMTSKIQCNDQQLLRQLEEDENRVEVLKYIYHEYVPYFEIVIKKKVFNYEKDAHRIYGVI